MRNTYFGETKEGARIKDLRRKSFLVFVIVGVFLAAADKHPFAIIGGIVPFFWHENFRHVFLRQEISLIL